MVTGHESVSSNQRCIAAMFRPWARAQTMMSAEHSCESRKVHSVILVGVRTWSSVLGMDASPSPGAHVDRMRVAGEETYSYSGIQLLPTLVGSSPTNTPSVFTRTSPVKTILMWGECMSGTLHGIMSPRCSRIVSGLGHV